MEDVHPHGLEHFHFAGDPVGRHLRGHGRPRTGDHHHGSDQGTEFPHDADDQDLADQGMGPYALQLRQRLHDHGGTEKQGQKAQKRQRFQAGEINLLRGDPEHRPEPLASEEVDQSNKCFDRKFAQTPGILNHPEGHRAQRLDQADNNAHKVLSLLQNIY